MLAFTILLIIGFIFSSAMYAVFAKNAVPEPLEYQAKTVIIGKESAKKAA